ncbi:putative peptidoglycan biosynthesis protein MurJ [Sedimentisphaera cyanobacteriorum]|uniref:Probable lipid II flippase MurJ n=1 Tax=Sedimentisphaera cyanobacteriorum TaxID=1940790 RepID=A0A1Q2HLX4_9BACT|nr:murein biosynthesis integral membrane protein MurJ [Sedimentisphaera cyanobacteriorum]AQQ08254.1 putative peptidoglycan biosynthesis protein MurJ [Sedimentisphaera cyanobacteriorum]
MFKGFRQIVSFTMLSRVLGMVRDICYSHFFGATALGDAWIISFRIPNLARRVFGEGAAVSSFIPVYSEELENSSETARKLANTITTAVFTILAGAVLLGWALLLGAGIFSDLTGDGKLIIQLTSIMLPYAAVICTIAIMAGILNVHGHFSAPAAAPVILNAFIISAILISGWAMGMPPRTQVFIAAFCVLIAGGVQTALQIYVLGRLGIHLRPELDLKMKAVRRVMLLMAPMILGATVTQINTLSDELIAWFFSGSEAKGSELMIFGRSAEYPLWRGSVMHLYLSQRLYQLPLGVFGISLATAIFPVLSRAAARLETDKMMTSLSGGIKMAVFAALPCSLGLIVVAEPLIRLLFENGREFTASDTAQSAGVLYGYAIGITGFFLQQILIKAFYAAGDSKLPAKTACWAVGINLVLNLILIWVAGAAGLALSTAVCSYLQVAVMLLVLRKRYGGFHSGFRPFLAKSLAASGLMFAAGLAVNHFMAGLDENAAFDSARIAAAVLISAAVYAGASKLISNEGLDMVLKRSLPAD